MRLVSLFLSIAAGGLAAPDTGKPAPPITVDHVAGTKSRVAVSLESLRGRSIVLEFWATWCTPCREQIPHLNALARKYRGRPVTFLALTDEDDVPLIERFLKQYPIEGIVGIDRRAATFDRYGIAGRPTTVLIDASGIVRGVLTSQRLDEQTLDLLIAGKPLPAFGGTRAVKNVEDPPGEPLAGVVIRPAAKNSGYSPGAVTFHSRTFRAYGVDLKRLISVVYDFPEDRIVVADRLPKDIYDVAVTVPSGRVEDARHLLGPVLERAIQFGVTSERRVTEVFVLTAAHGGVKNVRPASNAPPRIWRDRDRITGVSVTLASLAAELSRIAGRPVLDETGVAGRHDFLLEIGDAKPESVTRALEVLGLRLHPTTRPREYLTVQ